MHFDICIYRIVGNFCWVLIFAMLWTVYGVAKIKKRNNLFQRKFILSNLISIYRVFKRIKFVKLTT